MRGEHSALTPYVSMPSESSPHARGALVHVARELVVGGIIPACAGSTVEPEVKGGAVEDHPRMRGEHRRPRP